MSCKVHTLQQAAKVQQEASILDLANFEYLTSQLVCAKHHLYTDNINNLLIFFKNISVVR